ncbi:MAG: PIG-L deacetylase family protein, partial [Fidelibacterota bacterium]
MNILALGSHPDDLEYGCGGTLLKFSNSGDRVFLFIATYGEHGGDSGIRRREQERSAELIGAQELFWGGYKDTEIPLNQELIQTIENVIKKINPEFIFIHDPKDTHQDHRVLSSCTLSATRYVKNFLFYEVPTTQDFTPNIFVDIEDVIEKKFDLLKAHKSQVDKTNIKDMNILELARSNATFRGIQGRARFAEG